MDVQVSVPLAFAAGLVSFLSPCVLPVVPGYLGFVSALSVHEMVDRSRAAARRATFTSSALFMVGFCLVLLSIGLVGTAWGALISRSLPWMQRAGGVALTIWGLYLLWLPAAGLGGGDETSGTGWARTAGSFAAGLTFGAAWTPCIGPVLGSILLYSGQERTRLWGGALLAVYAAGLAVPFLATSVGLNWPLAGSRRVRAWAVPLRRIAGGVLAVLGLALVSGYFARATGFLAGLGQLINLEL